MDPQTLSTIILGLALAVSTLGARLSAQGRKNTRERNLLRRIVEEYVQYTHRLVLVINQVTGLAEQNGIHVPDNMSKPPTPDNIKEYLRGDEDE